MEVLVGRVFAGHLRSIIGGLTVEQIIRERDRVAQEVKDGSHGEVEKLGIVVDALEIQEIEDSSGYISNLAAPHAAAVASQARIAKARADQEATERELAAASMKAQFERDTAIKRAGFLAETDEAQARAAQAGPLAEAYRKRTLAEADRDQSRFAAEATAFSKRTIAEAEAEANTARAASLREGNQELIAANRLVEVLPALVDAAARGLAGSNLTILNGTQGVNEVVAGLVGQGLSILDALKNSASVNGAVTGTVAGPGPMTAAASTPSIEAD